MSEQEVDDFVVVGHDAPAAETPASPEPVESAPPSQPVPASQAPGDAGEKPPAEISTDPDENSAEKIAERQRDEAGRFKRDPQKRIAELTYKQREAERQRDYERGERERLAQQLDALQKGTAQSDVPRGTSAQQYPEYSEWVNLPGNTDRPYEQYVDERTDWRFALHIAHQQQQAHEQRHAERLQQHDARMAAFRERTPDYAEVFEQGKDANISAVMTAAILAADDGPDIVYYLLRHPDQATELAQLSAHLDPTDDASLLLMQRTLLSTIRANGAPPGSPARATRTHAAAPIKPVGTTTTTSDRPPGDDASFEAHAAYYDRLEQEQKRRYR